MKITKKAFIEAMVKNPTCCLGIGNPLHDSEEVQNMIINMLEDDSWIYTFRSCTAKSTYLEFSNDSRLYLNQKGNYSFYQYNYKNAIVYVCFHSVYSEAFEEYHEKALYYLVKA